MSQELSSTCVDVNNRNVLRNRVTVPEGLIDAIKAHFNKPKNERDRAGLAGIARRFGVKHTFVKRMSHGDGAVV